MLVDSGVRVLVTRRGQPLADACVDEGRALIGSAAHCDVRLAPDQAALEQLEVEARDGKLFATVRTTTPPMTHNHVPFHSGRLLDDSVLMLGDLRIHAELVAPSRGRSAKANPGSRTSVVVIAALVVAALVMFVRVFEQPGRAGAVPEAPPLFADKADVTCPERDKPAARELAEELLADANVRWERAPFLPQEGVLAVGLSARAAACAELAGQVRVAKALRAQQQSRVHALEKAYHLHQVRLSRALETKATEQVRVELATLSDFLQGKGGRYVAWLDRRRRTLDAVARTRDQREDR